MFAKNYKKIEISKKKTLKEKNLKNQSILKRHTLKKSKTKFVEKLGESGKKDQIAMVRLMVFLVLCELGSTTCEHVCVPISMYQQSTCVRKMERKVRMCD